MPDLTEQQADDLAFAAEAAAVLPSQRAVIPDLRAYADTIEKPRTAHAPRP
ncbi:hypothetical protein OHU11_00900 [Streptomyces sp. NBC_00257]|uniref:hypothetical protein n=1 Tax=Streptomyces TaxID=1883 RepID=UPI00224D9122|nr:MULTISPECIES: hypothetical protein [unclassified Streptomyces]WTB59398.1 hypothetical protein OG832_43040 [Streptomyces sp. NBC_00826]WTH87731.1 hypothetical protein OIC43_00680 [Streptomyces sp. NBC_00825]WTH96457.1 hypothetical protein OHA23_00690 [Streptomyces sp. NBC_00822]MCX4869921.1 hypothetical protein [Streptomyces sp. NBC_00906]MCX4901084.1 hypothetical protein [Streptomyces sp. NBC_00892]